MKNDSCDETIAQLEALFAGLPGLGPRSASRIVTQLLTVRRQAARDLATVLTQAIEQVHHCPSCHTLTTQEVCAVCADADRDRALLCIVESPADMRAIEESGAYRGGYFVLMGRVNPLEDIGPDQLGVPTLLKRMERDHVREVVIATSFTSEGETTAHMIATLIKRRFPGLRVTRLARGVPAGVEIEYTDAATLAAAVSLRR